MVTTQPITSFSQLLGHNKLSGNSNQRGGIRDQKGGFWDHNLGIRDQAVPFLWEQRPKFVTLLESRITNLDVKMGSAMKKHTVFTTQ